MWSAIEMQRQGGGGTYLGVGQVAACRPLANLVGAEEPVVDRGVLQDAVISVSTADWPEPIKADRRQSP